MLTDPAGAQVREVAEEAIQRARRGEGPTLIEAETYRFRGHSLADPDELRLKEEKEHYQARLEGRVGYIGYRQWDSTRPARLSAALPRRLG